MTFLNHRLRGLTCFRAPLQFPVENIAQDRDPFADAHLDYYRTNKPLIARFDFHKHGESENWDFPEEILHKKGIKNYISISFNSSQSGFMDVATGDFFPTGRL